MSFPNWSQPLPPGTTSPSQQSENDLQSYPQNYPQSSNFPPRLARINPNFSTTHHQISDISQQPSHYCFPESVNVPSRISDIHPDESLHPQPSSFNQAQNLIPSSYGQPSYNTTSLHHLPQSGIDPGLHGYLAMDQHTGNYHITHPSAPYHFNRSSQHEWRINPHQPYSHAFMQGYNFSTNYTHNYQNTSSAYYPQRSTAIDEQNIDSILNPSDEQEIKRETSVPLTDSNYLNVKVEDNSKQSNKIKNKSMSIINKSTVKSSKKCKKRKSDTKLHSSKPSKINKVEKLRSSTSKIKKVDVKTKYNLSYCCPECKEIFKLKIDAENHLNKMHGDSKNRIIIYKFFIGNDAQVICNVNRCPVCKETYFMRDQMLNHMLHKHLNAFLHIENCSDIFKRYKHNVNKFDLVYLCHKCPLNNQLNFFTSKEIYESHINEKHENTVDNTIIEQEGTELYIDNKIKVYVFENDNEEILNILKSCFTVVNNKIYNCKTCNYSFNNNNELRYHLCNKTKIDVRRIYSAGKIISPELKDVTFLYCPIKKCNFKTILEQKSELLQHMNCIHGIKTFDMNNIQYNNTKVYFCKSCTETRKNAKYYTDEAAFDLHFITVHINFKKVFNIARCKMLTKSYKIVETTANSKLVSQNIIPPLENPKGKIMYHCKLCKYNAPKIKNLNDHIKGKHKLTQSGDIKANVIQKFKSCYVCQKCIERKGKIAECLSIEGYISHYELLHSTV